MDFFEQVVHMQLLAFYAVIESLTFFFFCLNFVKLCFHVPTISKFLPFLGMHLLWGRELLIFFILHYWLTVQP